MMFTYTHGADTRKTAESITCFGKKEYDSVYNVHRVGWGHVIS